MDSKPNRVYNWIRAYIDENKFSANQKLPSENVLCKRLEVCRETVRLALGRLALEGLIYKIRGSGTYINKAVALSKSVRDSAASVKIALILQGQDANANSGLISGIKSVLNEPRADLHIFFTDNKFSSERNCLDVVAHQDFDGFIVDGVKASLLNPNLDCYRNIYRKKIPVIFYNNYYKELRYPKVINNDCRCAGELLKLLVRAGHKHIAGIFVYDNYQSIEKFRGYVSGLRKYGVEFDDDFVKWCVSNEAHSVRFFKEVGKFLKGLPKCTAVVCCNYMILQAVLKTIGQAGKSVPEDYSLVCFDYSKEDWETAGITCSVHPGYDMGRQVGKRLMQMIEHKEYDDHDYSYVFEPKIHIGKSIRCLGGNRLGKDKKIEENH